MALTLSFEDIDAIADAVALKIAGVLHPAQRRVAADVDGVLRAVDIARRSPNEIKAF